MTKPALPTSSSLKKGWTSRVSNAGAVALFVGQTDQAAGEQEGGDDEAVPGKKAGRVALQITWCGGHCSM